MGVTTTCSSSWVTVVVVDDGMVVECGSVLVLADSPDFGTVVAVGTTREVTLGAMVGGLVWVMTDGREGADEDTPTEAIDRVLSPSVGLDLWAAPEATTTMVTVVVGATVGATDGTDGAVGDPTSAMTAPASRGEATETWGRRSAPGPRVSTKVPVTTDKAMMARPMVLAAAKTRFNVIDIMIRTPRRA